jgi:hypothetical protein
MVFYKGIALDTYNFGLLSIIEGVGGGGGGRGEEGSNDPNIVCTYE